jgi:SpoIID/LytB domain protein
MTSHARVRPGRTILVSGLAAGALVFSLPTAPSTARDQRDSVPAAKTWKLKGHGYGHGHGMGQYGAQGAALKGKTHEQILAFYYPGTAYTKTRARRVRVLVSADRTPDVQVRPAAGLRVRDLSDRAIWTLPKRASISRWRLLPLPNGSTAVEFLDGRGWHRWRTPSGRRTFAGNAQFRATGSLTLLVPSGSDVVGKRYRGALRSAQPYPGARTRDTVNVVRMDAYVKGVVPYEMPTSWHPQALRAQAVAARTYATWQRAQNRHRYYQVCDTTACQVYGGRGAEVPSSNAAVEATSRRILTYRGKAAFTQFSASSGGWTSKGSVPYLPAKRDPYDDFEGNSVHTWRARVNPASLQRLHPNIGRLLRLVVTDREGHGVWGGRVQQIVLHGTRGRAHMTGDDFRWHFGLRSTWFTVRAIRR